MSRSKRYKRPPFENRWTSGERGWRWYQALEGLGIERVRFALAVRGAPPAELSDLAIATGFVRDWLRFHDRRERRVTGRWRAAIATFAALAAMAAGAAAWPIITGVAGH